MIFTIIDSYTYNMSKIRRISELSIKELEQKIEIITGLRLKNNNEKKQFMDNYTRKNNKIKKDLVRIKEIIIEKKKEKTFSKEKKLKKVCAKFEKTTKDIKKAKKRIKSEKKEIKEASSKPIRKKITVASIKTTLKNKGIVFKSSDNKSGLMEIARKNGILRQCYI